MSRDFRLYLVDICECCERVIAYVGDMSFEDFSADIKTIDAVVRNLEIIGEAIKKIPIALLDRRPDIDWKNVARFRDIIAHYYFRVKLTVVWDIIQNELGPLKIAAADILSSLPAGDN